MEENVARSDSPGPCSSNSSNSSNDGRSRTRGTETNDQSDDRRSSVQPKCLPINYEVKETDIICGRGRGSLRHEGNTCYLQVLRDNLQVYKMKAKKLDKSVLIGKIVKSLRQGGSRFIKFDKASNCWWEIGDEQARKKTGHAVRDLLLAAGNPMRGGMKVNEQGNDSDSNGKRSSDGDSAIDDQRKVKQCKMSPPPEMETKSSMEQVVSIADGSLSTASVEPPLQRPLSRKSPPILLTSIISVAGVNQEPESGSNGLVGSVLQKKGSISSGPSYTTDSGTLGGMNQDLPLPAFPGGPQQCGSGFLDPKTQGSAMDVLLASNNIPSRHSMMNCFVTASTAGYAQSTAILFNNLAFLNSMMGNQNDAKCDTMALDVAHLASNHGDTGTAFDPVLPSDVNSSLHVYHHHAQFLNMDNNSVDQELEPRPIAPRSLFNLRRDFENVEEACRIRLQDHDDSPPPPLPDIRGLTGEHDAHRGGDDDEFLPWDWL